MLNVELAKFRHASPYTAPRGKSDMSPVGVFVHELGHMVDFALERKFGTRITRHGSPWSILSRAARKEAITSYARTCAEEDFAETHRLYVLNPSLLEELSPERYKHMRQAYIMLFGSHNMREFLLPRKEFDKQLGKLFWQPEYV